jgi:hypothetical protein
LFSEEKYEEALIAFSEGIEISNQNPILYSNSILSLIKDLLAISSYLNSKRLLKMV